MNAAINGVPHLIWFKDKEGVHKKVNDRYEHHIGDDALIKDVDAFMYHAKNKKKHFLS